MKLLIARIIIGIVLVGCIGLLGYAFVGLFALANGGDYLWGTIDVLGFLAGAFALAWAVKTVSEQ